MPYGNCTGKKRENDKADAVIFLRYTRNSMKHDGDIK